MGYTIENNCVGPCPMGCIHCSHDYEQHYCDLCGSYESDDTPLYDFNGNEVCFECLLEQLEKIECADCDTVIYNFDGEWYCRECLYDNLEKHYHVERGEYE